MTFKAALVYNITMRLTYTRQIYFSAAHRYWNLDLSPQNNLAVYGSQSSFEPMGHNYLLKITAQNPISTLALESIKKEFHERYLNEDINFFKNKVPTTEALTEYCWGFIEKSNPDLDLKTIQLFEGDDLFCKKNKGQSGVILYRICKINCVHRHHDSNLSVKENADLYGQCSKVHGHEYTIEVGLEAELDNFGHVLLKDKFDSVIEDNIIKPYNKIFLNDKVGNASGEIITENIYNHLNKILSVCYDDRFRLYLTVRETRKNSFLITYCDKDAAYG